MRSLIRLLPAVLLAALLVLPTVPPSAAAADRVGVWPVGVWPVGVWPVGVWPVGVWPVGVWPLRPEPEVVARFDPPTTPYGPGHRGVDLLGRPGQQVRAALAGTVTYAGALAGRGVVVVSHGDTRTTYEPVAAGVSVGQTVGRGAVLGTLQPFASHCAPRVCLHWGWLRGDTYLDPLRLVGAGPVRLLPLWRDRPPARPPTPVRSPLPYDDWRPLATLAPP